MAHHTDMSAEPVPYTETSSNLADRANYADRTDSIKSLATNDSFQEHSYKGKPINPLRSHDSQRSRPKSELYRIISGIRDDISQLVQEPAEFGNAEQVLALQLTNESKKYQGIDESGEKAESEVQEEIDTEDEEEGAVPPDQGFAWVIAIVVMLAVVASWGSNAAYGVFLNYYMTADTFAGADKFDYGLIGGIDMFLAQFLAPLASLSYQLFGLQATVGVGLVLQTLGYILASFADKLWHLYLTQGLLVGISFCLVSIPPTLVLPNWFKKYSAFAFGIAVSGSGIGGILFALTVQRIIDLTGDQRWALRAVAFIALGCGIPALFLRTRTKTPKTKVSFQMLKHFCSLIFDIKVINSWPLIALAGWFCMVLMGYVVVLFSLSSYATSVGLTSKQASNITAILNVGQVAGRPLIGFMGDTFGRSNLASIICLMITILLFGFWINAVTYATIIPFAFMIGALTGVGSALCQAIARNLITSPSQLPAAWSLLNMVVGLACLPAEVLGLSLIDKKLSKPFLHCQIFTGVAFFVSWALMMIIRSHLVHKTLTKQLEHNTELLGPKRYLTVDDLNGRDEELIRERIKRYEYLLQPGIYYFMLRMILPSRV